MSAREQAGVAALDSLAFSLMGRLHVILRRQTGRVTDIEYMRIDPQYCRHVLDLASQLNERDMPHICARLHEIYFGPEGLFVRVPLKPSLMERLGTPRSTGQGRASEARMPAASGEAGGRDGGDDIDHAYIGRLR